MERIAEGMRPDERPRFSEFLLSRANLPAVFRSDMPLLRIVFPERSFFDTASARIRPQALNSLRLIAAALRREIPDVAVFVAGHADPRGTEGYNYNLSVNRANAVAVQLNALDVGGVALWRVGFGEAVPLVPNDSPEHMAINRRVEFIIGARAEPIAFWLSQQPTNFCSVATADVRRCLRPVARRQFVAVAVTRRDGLAVPLGRQSPRNVSGPAPARRLIIDFSVRRYRLPAPNPI